MAIKDEIQSLAELIAAQARGDKVRLTDRVEALKVLSSYYAMVNRQKPTDDVVEGSFQDFRKRIAAQ